MATSEGRTPTVLVAGASGIAGSAVAAHMRALGWNVTGLARRPCPEAGFPTVEADLRDGPALARALAGLSPQRLVIATWTQMPTERENCAVNAANAGNLLAALAHAPLEHVALVTGLKHYLGPFEEYGAAHVPLTPFREEQGRLPGQNFYYAQEDVLFAAAARQGFGWTVHRPHTIIGHALGHAMNMGATLAAYATLCRETGRPFLFPGSPSQWNALTDMTDAAMLARHVAWAMEEPRARNQALNIVNGDVFRWRWMWRQIAGWFGLEPVEYPGHRTPLEEQMRDDAPLWARIVARHGLAEAELGRVASPWHTDADLGRPMECVTDMSKSRKLGFTAYQDTRDAFFALFARMRAARVIP